MSSAEVSPVKTLSITLEDNFKAKGSVVFEDGFVLAFVSDGRQLGVKFRTIPMKSNLSPQEERQRQVIASVIRGAVDSLRRAT